MVTASGPSQRMVSRVWRAFALQTHRNETFERSKDLLFVEKVRDIAEWVPESPPIERRYSVPTRSRAHRSTRERRRAIQE